MKKLSIILLAAAIAGLSAVNAQAPSRMRTSAAAEKTAQKGEAPAPILKGAGKGAKGVAAAPASGVKNGAKKGGKKAAQKAVETNTPSSGLYMALKTNIAYDAFGVLNLAYECQFAEHWTAELPVMWSLWDWKESRGLRTVALQPGVKYWFSRGAATQSEPTSTWRGTMPAGMTTDIRHPVVPRWARAYCMPTPLIWAAAGRRSSRSVWDTSTPDIIHITT